MHPVSVPTPIDAGASPLTIPDMRRDSVQMAEKEIMARPLDPSFEDGMPTVLWPLIQTAGDDREFLKAAWQLEFDEHSHTALRQTLDAIRILLETVQMMEQKPRVADLLGLLHLQADDLDPATMANLEHILLCLQADMVHFLQKCGYDQARHVMDCQRNESIDGEDWFFEFPDAIPLSTSWPWCIKAALAVIWGVCWMFYPSSDGGQGAESYHTDAQGNTWNQDEVLIYTSRDPSFDQPEASAFPARPISGGQPQYSRDASALPHNPRPVFHGPQGYQNAYSTRTPRLAAATHGNPGPAGSQTPHNIAYTSGGTEQALFEYFQSTPPPTATHHSALPHRLPYNQIPTPAITFTTLDTCALPPPTPSSMSVFSAPPVGPGAQASVHYDYGPPPHRQPLMLSDSGPAAAARSEHRPSHSPQPQLSTRPRSRSDASINRAATASPYRTAHPSPSLSITGSLAAASTSSPQPQPSSSIVVHRDPPRQNASGQYVCTYSPQCSNLTFARKCEWSKHMDKHDRPYRCAEPACAKLPGFTYSGGLLRHEREVHGKHGGPREKLMCPVVECKRHTGQGFTRKENLAEHLRRVHKREATAEASGSAGKAKEEQGDTESTMSGRRGSEKRRRTGEHGEGYASDDSQGSAEVEAEHLRSVNKRLRQENREQADHIEGLQRELRDAQAKLRGQFRPA